MDLWRMILSEHANIEQLCQEVLEATPHGPNSRAELFDDLEDELDRHIAAKQNVLYPALAQDGRTETYLHELDDEHRDIRRRLDRLSAQSDMNSRQWALDFKELMGVIRHAFSLEENGALVAAHGVISPREADALRRAYEREKIASYEAARWHMPQAIMPSRYGMPTGMTFGILAGALAIGSAALAWNMSRSGQTRANRPLRPATRRPQPPFPRDRGMEGRASSGSMAGRTDWMAPDIASHNAGYGAGSESGAEEQWFSSANPPQAPSGVSTPLQPSGTLPSGSPASSVGSAGTGGQAENRDTGSVKGEGR